MILSYGTYNHPLDTVSVTIRREAVHDENGVLVAFDIAWDIAGVVRKESTDTWAAFKTKVDALKTAYEAGGKNLILYRNDGTTVADQLLTASCAEGTVIQKPVEFPQGSGPEWANVRTFSITVAGRVPATGYTEGNRVGEIIKYQYTQANYKWTRVMTGSFTVKTGQSVSAEWASFLAANSAPSGYQREPVGYTQEGQRVEFTVTDTEYWKALPDGVSSGGYTTSVRADGWQMMITRSGSFRGSGAQAAADAAKISEDGMIVLSEEQTANEYDKSVAFNYQYLKSSYGGGILSWREVVTIEEPVDDFVIHPIFGAQSIRQDSGLSKVWRATQEGSAEGTSRIDPPSPLWPGSLKSPKSVSYDSGDRAIGSTSRYATTWRYSFESANALDYTGSGSIDSAGGESGYNLPF